MESIRGIFDFKENKLGSSVFMLFVLIALGSMIYYFLSTTEEPEMKSSEMLVAKTVDSSFLRQGEVNTLTDQENTRASAEGNKIAGEDFDNNKSRLAPSEILTIDSNFPSNLHYNEINKMTSQEQCIAFPLIVTTTHGVVCDTGCSVANSADCIDGFVGFVESQNKFISPSTSDCAVKPTTIAKVFDKDGYGEDGFNESNIDRAGYDRYGFNADGFKRDGYNKNGFGRDGYDRDGYNEDGFNADGFDKLNFNSNGYDRNGYNRNGYNEDGLNFNNFNKDGCSGSSKTKDGIACDLSSVFAEDGFDQYGFSRDGYDRDGYDKTGYDRGGYNEDGLNIIGYDESGKDKDGYDKTGYNEDGYDKAGLDRGGYNEAGYDINGYDRAGQDIDGYNVDGYDINGYDKLNIDRGGYNEDGFNKEGFNADGCSKEGISTNNKPCNPNEIYEQDGFSHAGYDREGFGRDGYDINGYDREGCKNGNQACQSKDGYNKEGFDKEGFSRDGFNEEGFDINKFDRDGYDKFGYNIDNLDENGFNKKGFDTQGYNKNGFNEEGFDRGGFDKDGFDKEGYNIAGFNGTGYDREGFDVNAYDIGEYDINQNEIYEQDGFNEKGMDREGFGRDGYDINGYDRSRLNEDGFDKNNCHESGINVNSESCLLLNRTTLLKAITPTLITTKPTMPIISTISKFNKLGLDSSGFDILGYNKNGCSSGSIDRFGVSCSLNSIFTLDGYDQYGFDQRGFDEDGFDRTGLDINGYDREGLKAGFDKKGCAANGYTKNGDVCEFITTSSLLGGKTCINYEDGFHCKSGLSRDGFNRFGFCKLSACYSSGMTINRNCDLLNNNEDGFNCLTKLDASGYDRAGFSIGSFDKDGFDRAGFDVRGYNRTGIDSDGYNKYGVNLNGCTRAGYTDNGIPCKDGSPALSSNSTLDLKSFLSDEDRTALEAATVLKSSLIQAMIGSNIPNEHVILSFIDSVATTNQIPTNPKAATTNPIQANVSPSAIPGLEGLLETPAPQKKQRLVVPALSLLFGTLINDVNTDYPGPVMTKIISGPLAGAVLIGSLSLPYIDNLVMPRDKIKVSFDSLIYKGLTHKLTKDSVFAVSPETMQYYQSSEVNTHAIGRYGGLIASSFLHGISDIYTDQGVDIPEQMGSTLIIKSSPVKSLENAGYSALGHLSKQLGDTANAYFSRPPTIKLKMGSEMGIIFTKELYNETLPQLFQE